MTAGLFSKVTNLHDDRGRNEMSRERGKFKKKKIKERERQRDRRCMGENKENAVSCERRVQKTLIRDGKRKIRREIQCEITETGRSTEHRVTKAEKQYIVKWV